MITLWYLGFLDGYAGYVRAASAMTADAAYRDGEWDGLWQRVEECAS
jgi:hypothetical protein